MAGRSGEARGAEGGPVAVCGMHRSGTSLFARFLHVSGVDMGERLHVDLRTNPYGHYEDEDFLTLQRQELARAFDGEDYRVAERFEPSERFLCEARALLERRSGATTRWGWKDPRTTLFLDHWLAQLPELRVVALLREPRGVLDSLARRTRSTWSPRRKAHLLRVYAHHNEELARVARRVPERLRVVPLEPLIARPEPFLADLSGFLDLQLDPASFRELFDPAVLDRSRRAGVLFNRAGLARAREAHRALSALAVRGS
jgi:hypothetical protein